MMSAHRAGYIAIVGRPNVGKSTLLNRLVGQKISITSRRPQTTRHTVAGIVTRPGAQFVFVDTPGFQTRHASAMNRAMNRSIVQSLNGVDAVLFVVEERHFDARERSILRLLPRNRPVFLVINKVDKLADKAMLLPFIEKTAQEFAFAAIVPVAAKSGANLDELLRAVLPHLPQQPPLFGEDEITDRSERFLAAELIREKAFRLLGEELPYAVGVTVEQFETEGNLRRIHATIFVDKPGQKAIVIGRNGEKLKDLATQARQDMEKLFGGKVFLEVWVKVKSGWSDDERLLKQIL